MSIVSNSILQNTIRVVMDDNFLILTVANLMIICEDYPQIRPYYLKENFKKPDIFFRQR